MTRKQSEQLLFDEKLKPFYNINGNEYVCKKCNKNIRNKRLDHYNSCIGIGIRSEVRNLSITEPTKIYNYSTLCDMGCGNPSAFQYKNGKAYCCKLGAKCPVKVKKDSENKKGIDPFEGKVHPRGSVGKNPWNKGLTKYNNISIQLAGKKISQHHQNNPRLNYKATLETRAKLSAAAFRRKIGGYKIGAGKGKRGWYKGFFCDSSWELAYVIYCLEHNIDIKRNEEKRPYVWNGKNKNYIPDFIVNGELIEVKGYASPEWFAKHKANPDVQVLYENDLKDIFKYVKNKYGKNYIKLYEKVDKII